jgi:hypothetical protein
MHIRQASNEVLRDLFLEGLQYIANELGLPVPTELTTEGLGDSPEQLIELNISATCQVSITVNSGLLIVHKSVANTVHKFLGAEATWEQVEDSESLNIVMAPALKELWRRLRGGDVEMLQTVGIAA